MQNNKNFGISDSLIETVKEALKGGQKKLDVDGDGKLEKSDFEKLRARKEEAEVDEARNNWANARKAKDKQSIGYLNYNAKKPYVDRKTTPYKSDLRKDAEKAISDYRARGEKIRKEEVEEASKCNSTNEGTMCEVHGNKACPTMAEAQTPQQKAARAALATQGGKYDAGKKGGAINRMALMKKKDLQKIAKGKTKKEEVSEADEDPVAKQIAAKKDQLRKQIQQKIAQKQMSVMQQKAQKKIQNIKASNDKDVDDNMKKKGKDEVEVNPELREAEDLPKKVIKKGHEIAKSLIKHKAKVDEPYAVGMAQAKKSAGIKN